MSKFCIERETAESTEADDYTDHNDTIDAMPSYWAAARQTARTGATKYSPYKAIPSALSALAMWTIRHVNPLKDVLIPVCVGIGMYMLLYACDYLWNLLIIAPVKIDAERQKEIDRLRGELEAVRSDKARAFHQTVAENVIPGLSSAGKSILRYLWTHQKLEWRSDLTNSL